MENIDNATIENCRKLREACLENAEALVNSAKTLEGENTAHIRLFGSTCDWKKLAKLSLY